MVTWLTLLVESSLSQAVFRLWMAGHRPISLVPATGEVRRLGGIAGQLDGSVVRHPRLIDASQPAQQLGAGGVVGAVPLQRQIVHVGQGDLRTVELRDGDRPVE